MKEEIKQTETIQRIRPAFGKDRVEIIADENCEIIIEDGKCFVVRKQSKYPKTYEECCKVLGCKPIIGFAGLDDDEENLYGRFVVLKRCRDAYWKIAGDWKPDWQEIEQTKFIISIVKGEIKLNEYSFEQKLLAFPTAEMRDAFYDNFKDLIEQCKELL